LGKPPITVDPRLGILKPHNHVVAVQRVHEDFCVKVRDLGP
jgi:hypothetical protein